MTSDGDAAFFIRGTIFNLYERADKVPKLSDSRQMPYPADHIFDVILDVAAYPQILPFIRNVQILSSASEQISARVKVGIPPLHFSYSCQIAYRRADYITITSTDRPFKRLQARWQFTPSEAHATLVHYDLDSCFASPLMEATAGRIFAQQLQQSIRAFEVAVKQRVPKA